MKNLTSQSVTGLQPLIKEVVVHTSLEKAWKAISDKDEMKEWYFDIAEFRPEVGFEFTFEGRKDDKIYLHICKITEVIPLGKISYTWCYDGYPGESLVTFELFEEEGMVRVKLTHSGLENFGAENPDFAKKNFAERWDYIIAASLKNYLEV